MVENIQAFVEKIRSEGIEEAQKRAEDLLAEAKKEADQVRQQARDEREQILSDAKSEAEDIKQRGMTELELAMRDATLRLRDALNNAVNSVLAQAAKEKLEDTEFIGSVLHEIITEYGKHELSGEGDFVVNVPQDKREKLCDWAIEHIGREKLEHHIGLDLKGTLKQVGFEYNATGATVEVTLDSVVEVLSELVGPKLRDLLDEAMKENKQS